MLGKQGQIPPQYRNHFSAPGHRQCTIRDKIVLNVHNEERIAWQKRFHTESLRGTRPPGILSALLHEQADVGQHVLPFRFGQLPLPGMHRAEDDAVLDRSEQFLVGLEEGLEPVEIGRRNR